MASLLWTIITVLVVLWLIGVVAHLGGAFIHLLLVGALLLLVFNLITKGKATL